MLPDLEKWASYLSPEMSSIPMMFLCSFVFEELVSQLLAEMGFEMVEVTKLSGDGGIDVRGTLVVGDAIRIKMAVQAKKWNPKNRIQSPLVQQVHGGFVTHEQGLIITTSDFTAGTIKEAAQPNKTQTALMNGEQLLLLLMEHNIGITRSTPDLFEIDDEFTCGIGHPTS